MLLIPMLTLLLELRLVAEAMLLVESLLVGMNSDLFSVNALTRKADAQLNMFLDSAIPIYKSLTSSLILVTEKL